MKQAVAVRFEENGKETYFDPAGLDVHTGDYVMADTEQGAVCGQVSRDPKPTPDYLLTHPLRSLTRLADSVDIRRMHQRQSEDKKAWRICRECIDRHGLEMKLVKVEYAPDHSKVTFYFTADGRVDFRELVKDLASTFHMRIELRQIGVRDESKMMGGIGLCGQTFCCSRFLKDFQPVSIRMAKEQGLSLNPTKISGCCGRLMCCYEYLNSILPMVGSTVRTPDGTGTVVETNPISGYLRVRLVSEALAPKYYKASQCQYISGGKRAPRRPDPNDDYSGMRDPAPVVASADPKADPQE